MKILLIDNHALFREGLRHILQQLPSGAQILEAGSFAEGLELAGRHPGLDLALLEPKFPGSNGASSVRLFRRCYPHIPLVVVSGEESGRTISKALSYGAKSFVCKRSTASTLLDAIGLALFGGIHTPVQRLRRPAAAARSNSDRNGSLRSNSNEYGLTARQMNILRLLAAGLSNKDIAEAVHLAEGTVKTHVAAVRKNLRAKNRMEAVRVAGQLGLIDAYGDLQMPGLDRIKNSA